VVEEAREARVAGKREYFPRGEGETPEGNPDSNQRLSAEDKKVAREKDRK